MGIFRRKKKGDPDFDNMEKMILEGIGGSIEKAETSGLSIGEVEDFFCAAYDANLKLVKTKLAAKPQLGSYIDNLGNSALAELTSTFGNNPDRLAIAKLLLKAGANVNYEDALLIPLHNAIRNSNLEMVRVLVEHEADIHLKSKTGYEPIHCCTKPGAIPIVKYLLECGADINVRTNGGKTLLGALYDEYEETGNVFRPAVKDIIKFVESSGGVV